MSHSKINNLYRIVLALLAAALLLAGCPGNQSATTATPAQPEVTIAGQLPNDAPTAPPTPTKSPATATPIPAPTDTLSPTPTVRPPTPTPAPPTATPTPAPTDTPTPVPQPQTVGSANLRAGPGTNYAVVGSAAAQQAIEPLGRNEVGDWLQIDTATGEAWIAAFLVENVDAAGLPVRVSTAPTVTPVPQEPAITPQPAAQTSPAAGSVACGMLLPAPTDLQLNDHVIGITNTPFGAITNMVQLLSWRWDGLDQVNGLDWYFDIQHMLGSQPGNPVLQTTPRPLRPDSPPVADLPPPYANGVWTTMLPSTTAGSGSSSPEFFQQTCPPGEPRCPLHVRVQVALRDNNGNFACFISPPSNAVPLPLP